MISFTCSCGKSYNLPDRVGGREVRCNQCEKTLLVPKQSQNEPVVPLDDVPEGAGKPETQTAEAVPETLETGTRFSPVPLVAAIVALVVGIGLGASLFSKSTENAVVSQGEDAVEKLRGGADGIKSVVDQRSEEIEEKLKFPASEVLEAVGRQDENKRIEEMNQIAAARRQVREDLALLDTQERAYRFMLELADYCAAPAVGQPPGQELFAARNSEITSIGGWKVDPRPLNFGVRTTDGAPILLSLDGDPVAAAKAVKRNDVLDVLADAVKTDDEKVKDDQKHVLSYRIDSASRGELRLVWPDGESAKLDGDKFKEIRFSLYLPEKPNAVFKPGKPEGIDKTLILSSFAVRLVAENGYVEFVPANAESFVRLNERSRPGWLPVRIPMQGNEQWKRNDYGLSGPTVLERIELRAKPTGGGVTLWVDNLGVVE